MTSTILHGGAGAGGVLGDTWSWNRARWSQLPDGPPVAEHAMAYDAKRKHTVLFGGFDNQGILTKTWVFDGR